MTAQEMTQDAIRQVIATYPDSISERACLYESIAIELAARLDLMIECAMHIPGKTKDRLTAELPVIL